METTPPPESVLRSDLLIVTNGQSFNAEKMRPKLEALEALPGRWANIERIPTTIDDEYLDKLIPKIAPGCTVVIAGGDDTARRTLNRLHSEGFTGQEINIAIVGTGGENVVAQTLHGKKHYKDPIAIATSDKKRTIYPTEATMLDKDGIVFRTVRSLFSLAMGTSAIAMRQYFNRQSWREKQHQRGRIGQWLFKRLCAFDAIMRSPVMQTSRGKALDVTIAGGEFSAGRALKYGTSLSSPNQNILALTKPNPISLLGSIIGRKLGWAPGDTRHYDVGTIRIHSTSEAELDGNNIEPIPADTTLQFRRATRGIAVLALESE